MAKSNYLKAALLNHVFRATTYTSPAAVYIALFTVAPTDAGGGTEVTGGGYIRKAVTFEDATETPPVQISNTAAVDFGTATADWGTVVAFAAFDAVTAGNMLYWTALSVPRTISLGNQAVFAIGQLFASES
jgi:hypothetical protein